MKIGTPSHPKMTRFMHRLKLRRWGAVGLIESLLHFTQQFAPNGDLTKYSPEELAEALGWAREPELLFEALVHCKWLDLKDGKTLVHDWSQHCDRYVHNKMARARHIFADGTRPNLNHMSRGERAAIEADYNDRKGTEAIIAPDPEPEPKPKRSPKPKADGKPKPRDEMWDFVAGKWWPEGVIKSQATAVGRIVQDFKELGTSPVEILTRIERFENKWPKMECTPFALIKHWAIFSKEPEINNGSLESLSRIRNVDGDDYSQRVITVGLDPGAGAQNAPAGDPKAVGGD